MASWKKVIADGVTLTDIGTPASNDKILIQDTDGNDEVKYVDWGDVGGGSDVVNDTTPQLGGDLDTNGYYLDMSSNTASTMIITANQYAFRYRTGGGVINDAGLFFNATSGSFEFIKASGEVIFQLKAGTGELTLGDLSGTNYFTLPYTDGTANQVLQTDGSGNVDWADVGAVNTYTNGTNNYVLTSAGSDSINGEANLTFDGSTLDITGNIFVSGVTGFSTLTGGRIILTDTHYDDTSTTINANGEWGVGSRVSTTVGPSASGLTAGDLYMMGASGWGAASATASVGRYNGLLAIATGSSTGSGMLFEGAIYVGTDPGGSIGDVCYISTTAGAMTTTVPTGSGEVARVCGYKIGTNMVYFKPSPDWIKL